jgi:TonB family protein
MGLSATQLARIQSRLSEQRLCARRRVGQPIPIELLPGNTVWLHDLSEGGLSVSGSVGVETGTMTDIRFDFPETNSVIDAAGVVAWTDLSGRAGVRFTHIEPDSTESLRQWLLSDEQAPDMSVTEANIQDSELTNSIACLQEVSELKALISSQQLDNPAALDLIVRRMMELTRATGAAIVLREGDDAICRASAGNAPDVGVKLSSASLTGECFRTGAMVVLEDSEKDPRVNPEICRQLNFRSLVVMPVVSEERTVGILEVLSPKPMNFEGGDVLVLSFVAELIAGIAAPSPAEQRAIAANLDLESFLHETTVEDVLEDRGHLPSSVVEDPAPEVEPPSEATRSSTVPKLSQAEQMVDAASRVVPTVAPERPVVPLEVPAIQVRVRLAEELRSRKLRLVVAVVLGVVLLIITAIFLFSSATRKTAIPATSQPKSLSQTSAPSAPAPTVASTASPSSLESRAVPLSSARPAPAHRERTEQLESKSSKSDEIKIRQGTSIQLTDSSEAAPEAPAVGQIENHTVSTLPSTVVVPVMAPAAELGPVQSKGVTPGKLLRKVAPRYPEMALRAGISGDVVLTGTIGKDGSLHNLKVISGSPLLQSEAVAAAKQWKYVPYLLDGKAIETDTRITISFHR